MKHLRGLPWPHRNWYDFRTKWLDVYIALNFWLADRLRVLCLRMIDRLTRAALRARVRRDARQNETNDKGVTIDCLIWVSVFVGVAVSGAIVIDTVAALQGASLIGWMMGSMAP